MPYRLQVYEAGYHGVDLDAIYVDVDRITVRSREKAICGNSLEGELEPAPCYLCTVLGRQITDLRVIRFLVLQRVR